MYIGVIKISLAYALEGLYHFNGDVTDSSGNGNDGTNNNVSFVADKEGNSNSAGSFNGTDSYVDITNADISNLGVDTGRFSISFWFNPNDVSSSQQSLFNDWHSGDSHIILRLETDKLYLYIKQTNGSTMSVSTNTSFSTSNWYYIVAYADGSEIGFYVDKIKESNTTSYDGTIQAGTGNAFIGARDTGSGIDNYYDGLIDELRFYPRALTQYEITQLYYGYDTEKNQVGILNEGLVYASHFNSGTATDWTDNGNDGTVNGATATTGKNGNPDSALDFDGNDDYVDIPDTTIENQPEITISTWINADTTSGDRTIVGDWASGDLVLLFRVQDGNLDFFTYTNSQAGGTFQSFSSTNTWNHVVATYDGSEMRVYVNGVDTGTTFSQSGTLSTGSDSTRIGERQNAGQNFDGKIDEVRIYSRALSPVEVLMLYKGYDSEQNSQDTFDIDLEAYYPFTGDYVDATGNGYDGTNNGTTFVADKNGESNQAIELNGTSNYVQLPYISLGSSNFSVLTTINLDANDGVLLANNLSGTEAEIFFHVNSSSQLRADGGGFSSAIASNETLNNNEWYSVGFSRNSSDGTLYINGNKDISNSVMSDYSQNEDYEIGYNQQGDNAYLNGTLDEMRIYKRNVTQDESIEYTYSYDTPTMLDDDDIGDGAVTRNSLFSVGGI